MRYLLDSNVIIDAIMARVETLQTRMAACYEDDFVTSTIAYAEVAHGSKQGKPPPLEILDAFLTDIPVLPFDRGAALVYASLPFKRASYDQLIAAHAISLDLTLVTGDEHDFDGVPHLSVENWTRP